MGNGFASEAVEQANHRQNSAIESKMFRKWFEYAFGSASRDQIDDDWEAGAHMRAPRWKQKRVGRSAARRTGNGISLGSIRGSID